MKFLILSIIALSFFSCKPDSNQNSAEEPTDSISFQQKIEIEDPQFALEPEARDYALNWVEFITAQNEIRKLDESSVNQVISNAATIAEIMESLQSSLPDSLNAVPVEARLNVINTKAQLLKQYSARQDPRAEDIKRTARELNLEFNNLKLQMNELFLKTLEEFEKELDDFEELERETDSLNSANRTEKIVS